jgi:hypothetical protein
MAIPDEESILAQFFVTERRIPISEKSGTMPDVALQGCVLLLAILTGESCETLFVYSAGWFGCFRSGDCLPAS